MTEKFKYLGVSFDRKLSWNSHIEDVTNRASKRLSLLKILAGSKWGCSRSTLNLTYNAYVLPIMTYCCEPLVSASKKVIDSLEGLQNQAMRLISGAVKSTPIDYLLLCTDNRPFSLIVQERALLLWERIIRTPGCLSMWTHFLTKAERNLKTQRGFVQGVSDLISHLNIDHVPQQFLLPRNPIESKIFSIRLDMCQAVLKTEDNDVVLRTVAYETLNYLYPSPFWLRVYTDGSKLNDCANAGAGVHCEMFSFYSPVGAHMSAFDGEIYAIRLALSQLQNRLECFNNVVLLSDSKAALQAIDSPCSSRSKDIDDCVNLLAFLSNHNKTVVLQWIPAHCGIEGNEAADLLAKRGASILQLNPRKIPYHTIKTIIRKALKCSFYQDITSRSGHKTWFNKINDIPEWPREKSVALLRLFCGHDCLRKHLHRINLAPDPFCTLCGSQEEMDMLHLDSCPALPPVPLWKRYWIARHKLMD